MASLRGYMYLLVFCVCFFFQILDCCGSIWFSQKHAALFVFGDSLFDAGMNNYINTTSYSQANYPPYGETFFRYPTGRFSDDRVIPDFIGAGALVETAKGYVVDLHTQLSYYKNLSNVLRKKLGNEEAKALLSKAVHLFSVGAADYEARFVNKSSVFLGYSQQKFLDIVIGNLTTSMKEIYEVGGRKFAVVTVGPVGCSPSIRILVEGNKCNEQLLEVVRLHNIQLSRTLQKLEKQLQGFKYSLSNLYTAASQLSNYPTKYGFKQGQVACCGGGAYRGDFSCGGKRGIKKYELCENVNDYVVFDSAHPSEKANQHYSNLMWSGNRTVNKPYNLKQLFEF